MAGVPKSGVNWAEIELAWKGGASPSKLAKLHNVTRQAIENRRDRHGWERDEAAAALVETETGQRITKPETKADRRIIANGQRTLANMQMVLELLSEGASIRLAAERIGMAASTLHDWLKDDEDFGRLARAAQAEATMRRLDAVVGASQKGDWRAAAWLLERSPLSRDEYAPRQQGFQADAPGIVLNLHLDPHLAATLAARVSASQAGLAPSVIDHEEED